MRSNPYRKPDRFTNAAKKAGYPARSVFKLSEIDKRVHLLSPGQRVLDLGAAPGSWARYASERVGPRGRVVAVDPQPVEVALPPNVTFIQGDVLALDPEGAMAEAAPYDVVLSDMAPSTTGNKLADQARSVELFLRALAVCDLLLARGGKFVGKIFMGEDFPVAREEVRTRFDKHRLLRPEAVRSVSCEVFVHGEGKK
jgi:23S rRNA (uridine2552-2'-O)-methyltransferase